MAIPIDAFINLDNILGQVFPLLGNQIKQAKSSLVTNLEQIPKTGSDEKDRLGALPFQKCIGTAGSGQSHLRVHRFPVESLTGKNQAHSQNRGFPPGCQLHGNRKIHFCRDGVFQDEFLCIVIPPMDIGGKTLVSPEFQSKPNGEVIGPVIGLRNSQFAIFNLCGGLRG